MKKQTGYRNVKKYFPIFCSYCQGHSNTGFVNIILMVESENEKHS